MTAIQENLTRAQRVIIGQSFETKHTQPLIKESLSPGFPHVEVFPTRDQTSLRVARGNGLQIFRFRELPTHLVACERDITIRPESFAHSNSGSRYRSEEERGKDIFLLSYTPPGVLTTYHVHPKELTDPELLNGREPIYDPIVEEYDIVFGQAKIHFEQGDQGVLVPNKFSVRAGVAHQMEGGQEGTISAIRMISAALYPPDVRHIPISFTLSG